MQFPDIFVAPYDGLYGHGGGASQHRGGPVWPDWDNQDAARHCRGGRPVDDCPDPPETWREIETAHWCGPVVDHFGHMLAEYSMRLLPAVLGGPPAPLLFYGMPPHRYGRAAQPFQAAPAFFRDMIAYAGRSPAEVIVETGGLKVGLLHVEPQAEQIGGIGPRADHLDRLDGHAERMLGPVVRTGPVFVSRAGQFARFAGEAYLEEVMKAAGVTVIRPETLALAEQLKIYRAASPVFFSEGSALHAPQLLGRCFGDVVVFNRRAGERALNIFSLTPRCRSLGYRSFLRGLVTMLGPGGKPRRMFALSLIDPGRCLETMRGLGVAVDHLWDDTAFRAAEDRDVAAWLAVAKRSPGWSAPGSPDFVDATLRRHFGTRFAVA